MKVILFCCRPYCFSMLHPLQEELDNCGDEVLWYVNKNIVEEFPYKKNSAYTTNMQDLYDFKSDAIYVPTNSVPHFLRGLKVQIFHGLAGEKKGHFRIRNYFDLYLTQGPYFTSRFERLANKYKNFSVRETGWSKLDELFKKKNDFGDFKTELINVSKAQKIILYAPTFSPSLTSAEVLFEEMKKLACCTQYLILVKFHEKMDAEIKALYIEYAKENRNLLIVNDHSILKYLVVSDLMISDTSSVVYEFLMLNKPVITLNSTSENIKWTDIKRPNQLRLAVDEHLYSNEKLEENWIFDNYHPYEDAKSSKRMVSEVRDYIEQNGVPKQRNLSFFRRYKIYKEFGKVNLRN